MPTEQLLTRVQYVSCPLHKRNFALTDGECVSDPDYSIISFKAREDPNNSSNIELLLPPEEDTDAILGTEKWMVRQAQSEAMGLFAATQVEIVGPMSQPAGQDTGGECASGGGCGSNKLEW